MTFADLANLIGVLALLAIWIGLYAVASSAARDRAEAKRRSDRSAQISALRAAAVKGDRLDILT